MPSPRALSLITDVELLDDALRLAAAAGCELERVPDVSAARLRWSVAPLVLLDVQAASLRAALPALPLGPGAGELSVLSSDRSGSGPRAGAVSSVLDAGRRAGDTVVCDVPRYPTPAAVAALDGADLIVLVVPTEVHSTASASRVAAVLRRRGTPVRLVVRGPAPGGVTPGDVAAALGLPLLHAMRPQPGLARALERGTPPGRGRGPLAAAARVVLEELRQQVGAPSSGESREASA